MGYLLPALTDDEVLEPARRRAERAAAELREPPVRPGGVALAAALFPPDHPYHWITIGEPDDLRAASLDDVQAFFQTYYHPGNASLALAGDIETERALELAEQYFGEHPARAGAAAGDRRRSLAARAVAAARGSRRAAAALPGWHSPAMFARRRRGTGSRRRRAGHGKTSRLYRRLVYERASGDRRLRVSALARAVGRLPGCRDRRAAGVSLPSSEQAIVDGVARARRRRARLPTNWARRGADRGAVRLSPADGWRLRRQVGSTERLQRVQEQSRILRRRTSQRYAVGDGAQAWPRQFGEWLVGQPRVALSLVPRGRRGSGPGRRHRRYRSREPRRSFEAAGARAAAPVRVSADSASGAWPMA